MEAQGQRMREFEHSKKTKHIKSVKGSTVISGLPLIDISTCLIPEDMHSVLLGVNRQITSLWFTIVNNKSAYYKTARPWNITKKAKKVDDFLLNIRPPHFCNRMPRRITVYQSWKASEFYNWILFYSVPAIIDYLPAKYVQHWLLFVKSLFILLQERIHLPEVQRADELLKIFVADVAKLYSDRELSYNIHQLLHLALSAKRWGPLWATSAFPFENYNGFLGNCVHGSKHLGQEIVNNLLIAQGVQILKNKVEMTVAHRKETYVIGKGIDSQLININERELLTSKGFIDNINSGFIYARAKILGANYTSEFYKITKTNSYTVQIDFSNNITKYGAIRFFFESDELYFVIRSYNVDHSNLLCHEQSKEIVNHIIPITESNNFLLIKLSEVKAIFQLMGVGKYICRNQNTLKKIL